MRIYDAPRLRGVLKSDIGAIAELEATAFGTNSLTRSALDVIYDPSGGLWLLAEDDEGVWGHSVNARDEDPRVGWILGMAIHPERQSRGWANALLAATIDHLRDSDMGVIRLLVNPTNKVARRLYENFGFIDTGERRDHFGPGQDRMVMSLLLDKRGQSESRAPAGRGGTANGRINGVSIPQVPVDPEFL